MNLVSAIGAWLTDPAHWSGSTGIPARLLEHLGYSALAMLIGLVVAVPLGAYVGHTGKGGFLVVGIANGMRALPELGLLILLVVLMGIGLLPVVLALSVLAIPPLLAGTYSGVSNVDKAVVDAARGIGMREGEVLLKVELPNALPLLMGGVRAAALQVVATAAVAAYVSFGGLGRFLIDGLQAQDYPQMAVGAVLVAVLALVVEAAIALLQRAIVSPGLRPARRVRRARPAAAVPTQPEPELAGVPQ